MYAVVRNEGSDPISHVQVDIPILGWTPIPMPIVAARPTVAPGGRVSQGLGRKPPTWTPSVCPVRFTDNDGRGWRRDGKGKLRRDRPWNRWQRDRKTGG